jgi:ethanolamine utilization protein EutQ (cupin superfamily)
MAPRLISEPSRVAAAGVPPKLVEELVGRVNTGTATISIAKMTSPAGWSEPGQTPEFDEWTVVLSGALHIEHRDGALEVGAGQAAWTHAGEWVRYSTAVDTEYLAVCLPAFSPETVHRDG